jgi:hypothetical protein
MVEVRQQAVYQAAARGAASRATWKTLPKA